MSSYRWTADLVLLMVAMVWGLTFVIIQDAIATLPPFAFNAARFGFAAALLFIFQIFRNKKTSHPKPVGTHLKYGILLGIFLFAGYALQTYSLLYTTSGKSGFLTGLSVALVPILSYMILGQKPKLQALIGAGLAVGGLYFMAFSDLSSINIGDSLAFLCAIAFGLQLVYTAKYTLEASTGSLVLIQLLTVAVLSGIFALIFEPSIQIKMFFKPTVLIALMITSIFATVFAYIAQTHYIKFTSAARVALIFATEPVFAAIGDYVWNDALLGPLTFFGCLLILAGMILAEIPLKKAIVPLWRKKEEILVKNPCD